MTPDPTTFDELRRAEVRLRARVTNLTDSEIAGLTASAFLGHEHARSWRLSGFWVSMALLLQEEQCRRDAIYANALDPE